MVATVFLNLPSKYVFAFSAFCQSTGVVNTVGPSQDVDDTEHPTSLNTATYHYCCRGRQQLQNIWQSIVINQSYTLNMEGDIEHCVISLTSVLWHWNSLSHMAFQWNCHVSNVCLINAESTSRPNEAWTFPKQTVYNCIYRVWQWKRPNYKTAISLKQHKSCKYKFPQLLKM